MPPFFCVDFRLLVIYNSILNQKELIMATDSNCSQEMNKQMQGIMARLSQAENNITNHYTGMSMLVQSMNLNPFTAGSSAVVSSIYNLGPAGMAALQGLIDSINPLDFKLHMMDFAMNLIPNMSLELDSLLASVENMILNQINSMVNTLIAAAEAQIIAVENLAIAIASGIQAEIDAAGAALQNAANLVNSLSTALDGLKSHHITATGSLKAQSDVSKCKSSALHIAGG